ncbi:MAG: polysaccharide biosynthesis protein, partial [Desulforhopalus sp.]
MGASVKIVNLAHNLIKLMGYEPGKEIEIQYTGLRPGEKLYEELITVGEGIVPTKHEKIMVLRGENERNQEMEELLKSLARVAGVHDAYGIKGVLQAIIPEYKPDMEAGSTVQPLHANVEKMCN